VVEEPVAKVAKVETPVDKVDATFSTSLPRPGETFISSLKRKLTDFIKAGNSNHFRTRKE